MIDTKSFYASVEAVARGLHPMKVPLVVVSKGPNVGGGGLVLAISPMAKKRYGLKHNVSRLKDLQGLPDLIQVPPRINGVAFISLITQQPGNAKQKQQQPSLLGNVMRK